MDVVVHAAVIFLVDVVVVVAADTADFAASASDVIFVVAVASEPLLF